MRKAFNAGFITLSLTAFATGAVVVALLAKMFPLVTAKTIYFCQQFLSNTLFQIPRAFPNALILALTITVLLGILSFLIQVYKTRKLWRRYAPHVIRLPKNVQKVSTNLQLKNNVHVVSDVNLFSFCVGFLFPRIVMSSGLVDSLSDKELEAVLLHEQAHIQNFDPLKMIVGQTIASMFFFLPIFRELNKNMTTVNELLADNWTIQQQQTATFIKGAMKKILTAPDTDLAGVPAISQPDSLETRIYQLANPANKHRAYLSFASIITTVLFLVFGTLLVRTPVDAFQLEHSAEPSYFFCSGDTMCRKQCHHTAQMSPVTSPEDLFSSYTPTQEVSPYK